MLHRILVEEQAHDLVSLGQQRLGEQQGATGRRGMRGRKQGNGKFHGRPQAKGLAQ